MGKRPLRLSKSAHKLVKSRSWSTVKVDRNGLQFFWRHVLKREGQWVQINRAPRMRTLADILNVAEVEPLVGATRNLRYRRKGSDPFVSYTCVHRVGQRGPCLGSVVSSLRACRCMSCNAVTSDKPSFSTTAINRVYLAWRGRAAGSIAACVQRLNQKMVMVGHQPVAMNDPVEPSPYAREHVEEQPPVADCPKDVLTSVDARSDVVERTGKFQPVQSELIDILIDRFPMLVLLEGHGASHGFKFGEAERHKAHGVGFRLCCGTPRVQHRSSQAVGLGLQGAGGR
jgi:hypothetical protein